MPPFHVLLHSPHFGIPAVLGAVLGLFLGWPQEHTSGDLLRPVITYENALGMVSSTVESGYWTAFFCAAGGALIGAAIGAVLVSLGVVTKEDIEV